MWFIDRINVAYNFLIRSRNFGLGPRAVIAATVGQAYICGI